MSSAAQVGDAVIVNTGTELFDGILLSERPGLDGKRISAVRVTKGRLIGSTLQVESGQVVRVVWRPPENDMSGVVVVDARHAKGSAGKVMRAYQRARDGGGVYDEAEMRHRLASTIPIDSLRAADQAFVRVSDREWVTVKDRYDDLPKTIGPEEMSEILARQRRVELGMVEQDVWRIHDVPHLDLGDGTVKVDPNAPLLDQVLAGGTTWDDIKWPYAAEVLKDMITKGSFLPDGSDVTLQFGDVFESGHSESMTFHAIGHMWHDDIDRNVANHAKTPAGPDPIDRGEIKRAHPNDAYAEQERQRLAQRGLTPEDARRIAARPRDGSFWWDLNKMQVVDDPGGNA